MSGHESKPDAVQDFKVTQHSNLIVFCSPPVKMMTMGDLRHSDSYALKLVIAICGIWLLKVLLTVRIVDRLFLSPRSHV